MTIGLTEQELREIKEHTGKKNAAAAVRAAMQEYLRYVRRMRLKKLSGKIRMQDNWKMLEEAEMKEIRGHNGPRAR